MSDYEKSYLAWYGKKNLKKLLVSFIVLLVMLILPIMMTHYDSDTVFSIPLVPQLGIVTILCVCLSVMMPVIQFQYSMKKRSCDLYLPLPIKQNRFFLLQFGIGLSYIVVPILLFFLVALCYYASWVFIQYYAIYFLVTSVFLLALYSITTCLVVHCNSFWDAVCVAVGFSLVLLLLYVSVISLLRIVVIKSSIGASSASEFFPIGLIGSFISPMIAIGGWISGLRNAFDIFLNDSSVTIWDYWVSDMTFIWPVVFWAILGILACILAYRTYKCRTGEQSEQRTTSKLVYPLMIFLITTSLLEQNMFEFHSIWVTIVVFLVMNFIAERKIVIRSYMVVSFIIMSLFTGIVTFTLMETNVFHTIYEIPVQTDVKTGSILIGFNDQETASKYHQKAMRYFSTIEIDNPVVLSEVYELHQDIVDSYEKNINQNISSISITYKLNNGEYINRNYAVDLTAYNDKLLKLIDDLFDKSYINQDSISYFELEN